MSKQTTTTLKAGALTLVVVGWVALCLIFPILETVTLIGLVIGIIFIFCLALFI